MSLAEEDIELINHIVKQAINDRPELKNANVRYELDLRERTIRVEEELKHQRELMIEGFKQMEKHFKQADKHFEASQSKLNPSFEEMGRRSDRFMFWSFFITISAAIFAVNYLK